MAGIFPAAASGYTNPSAATDDLDTSVGGRQHDDFHADNNDDIEALATKLGIGSSTATKGLHLRGNVTAGASVWADLPDGNALLNGDFSSAQRSTMPTTDDNYGHDQWILLLEAANAATVSTESTDVPSGGSRRAAKLTVGSGNNNKFGYFQPIEGRRMWHMRGQTVSLQFKLKTTSAIGDIRVGLVQWTSTEDSITSDIVSAWGAAATNPTLVANWAFVNTPASLSPTTSWATYKLEAQSVSASANNLGVFIWCDDKGTTQTTDYMLITDVQLEIGPTCTAYQRMPAELTRLLCQRYYLEHAADTQYDVYGTGHAISTTQAIATMPLPIAMRAAPTLSVSAAADMSFFDASAAGAIACSAVSINSYVNGILSLLGSVASGLVAGNATELVASNTSSRIRLTAEL